VNASPRSRSFSFATNLQAVAMILTLSGVLFTSGCVGYAGKPGTAGGVSGLSMDVSPSSLGFGSLTVGQSASKILTITNTGTQSLAVSGISVTGSGFTMKPIAVPMALAVGQSASVSTTFTAAASGPVSGQIMISSNAPDSPVVVALTAAGVSKSSDLTVTPASLSFGDVKVGSESTQTVRLTNSGSSSMAISAVSASGTGISLSGPSFPVTLAAGASTSLNAMFKPTVAGNASGTLTISSDAANSPDAIGWSGTATSSSTLQLTASPASENFGTVSVGSSGSAMVQLKNTGTASVKISAIAMSGPGFTLSSLSLPMTLAANQAATLTAGFKPTTSGQFSGHITVTSNATDSPTLVSLSGAGASAAAALTATPSSISFGTVPTGTSTTQTVRMSNLGESPLTISSVTASGTGLSFAGLTTPMNIAAGQNANLTVALKLSSAGAASGEITITSNAPGSPTQIAWSATAQASVVTLASNPASLSFGNVSVGTTDTLQTTIKNTGNSNANISMISVSGTGFTLNGSGSAVTLGPGQSLTVSVSFDPKAAGSDSGKLTIASNASNPQLAVALAGSGATKPVSGEHSVALAWDASTSSVVGYYVYRGSQPGGPYARLNSSATTSTSFSDSTVSGGEVYYYVVTALNSSNIESTDSNQVSVTIP
jgi:hypothetical protein